MSDEPLHNARPEEVREEAAVTISHEQGQLQEAPQEKDQQDQGVEDSISLSNLKPPYPDIAEAETNDDLFYKNQIDAFTKEQAALSQEEAVTREAQHPPDFQQGIQESNILNEDDGLQTLRQEQSHTFNHNQESLTHEEWHPHPEAPEYNEELEKQIREDGQSEQDSEEEESEDDGESSSPELNNKRVILQRFTIYNSKTTMYIVGSNAKESLFRILEIGKDPKDPNNLMIIEDKSYFYTRKDMVELINGLNESSEGGIHKISQGYGLLGLIKFTKGYYLSIITKCSQVAILGGHFIYHVDETKLIPLDFDYKRPNKYSDEERLLSIFKYLDLGKTFYFSYAYDITNTLQTNFIRHKKFATEYQMHNDLDSEFNDANISENFRTFEHNERFVWNNLLLKPILENTHIATYEWFQPIIHGFIDQAKISIFGKKIYITIIARRSHHFAGARFLKRGVNDKGNVANEIETEQIVSDMLILSFHDPKYGFFNNPRYTSFVQHRGSIPLYWTQDLNRLPKPPIEINLMDPFYQSSAIHFNNLFQRYGSPVIILNLIKTKEKQPRELKLNQHFSNCITYLNQFLPEKHKLQFNCFDMSKHSKKNLDVIRPLQKIAVKSIDQVGFFHNGQDLASTRIQKGIIRTNCIDCLDRTNAAQFIICKEALSYQLASLGLISESTNLDYDSDLINILTEIFHDHGDTIAVQYGGSNLVNTMDSYRRINQWSSHTRDILNSIKRIYSNSFMDQIRQEAINLFLGNYVYDASKPKLWELQNDFFLHNNSLIHDIRVKISYQHWFNANYLSDDRFDLKKIEKKKNDPYSLQVVKLEQFPEYNDNWYNECYVPRKYQSLSDLFQFNMNSNARYFPSNIEAGPNTEFDYSPFESRKPFLKASKMDQEFEFKTSKSGAQNLKYLDNCAEEDKVENEETENMVDEPPNDKSDSTKTEETQYHNYPQDNSDNNSNYNVSNSNKIKNFLATKIEKLGYNNKNSSDKGTYHDDDESYRNSPNYTTSSRFESGRSWMYTPILDNMQPLEQDQKLYKLQSDILTLASSLQTLDENEYNSSLWMMHSLEDVRDDNGVPQWLTLNYKDMELYSQYLGMEDDKLFNFNTEDDYFN